jgi:hypothetical protein
MAQMTRAEFDAILAALIEDNTAQSITPDDLRTVIDALMDSVLWYDEGDAGQAQTFTGPIDFSGTDHLGLRHINLTTAERDLLTPALGDEIFNTSADELQVYTGSGWVPSAVQPGGSGSLDNLVEDTTPQLGGNLDLNGKTVGVATAADLVKLNAFTFSAVEGNRLLGVTSAIQTQLDAKVAAASPTLTGTPIAPNPALGTDTTQIATMAAVQDALALRSWSAATAAFPTGALAGWRYRATTAGTINGITFAPGDVIEALIDSPSSSVFSANWARDLQTTPIAGALTDSDTAVTVGVFPYGIPIGPELAGANVVAFRINAHTAATDGSTTFTLNRRRAGTTVEVLSADLTLPVSTYTATTSAINTSNDDLAAGDLLYPEVATVPTTAPFGVSYLISVRLP